MKKLVFMFVAMAAVSFASCGGSDKAGAANDSTAADSQNVNAPAVEDSLNADSANTVAAPVAEDSVAQ